MDRFKGNLTETPSRFRLASGSLPARFRLASGSLLLLHRCCMEAPVRWTCWRDFQRREPVLCEQHLPGAVGVCDAAIEARR